MNRFKHSGTLGDIIYSLPVVKFLGGGEFYLHLHQIDWIGQHYYGSKPTPFHQGRMTEADLEFMRDFFLAQDYITDFKPMTQDTEITHNLDRFRELFVAHPGNYVDIYAHTFGLTREQADRVRTQPWLTVPAPVSIEGRPYVVNRTARWTNPASLTVWQQWRDEGVDQESVFVGLPEEYAAFKEFTGWQLDYYPTQNMLELASVIAGAQEFIGNQSVALSLAIGLGVGYACELRADLPRERNECYFPDQPGGDYF